MRNPLMIQDMDNCRRSATSTMEWDGSSALAQADVGGYPFVAIEAIAEAAGRPRCGVRAAGQDGNRM